jgi:xanthine dehydrogenase accessory protein XdhC
VNAISEALRRSLSVGEPSVLVTVAAASGSTPREAGARMLVATKWIVGTIGGGRLEHNAIAAARRLIAAGLSFEDMRVPLGPAIGQCCGGRVTLRLQRADERTLEQVAHLERAERDRLPAVYLFGAGHVGKAIAQALAPLPVRLIWVDSRADEFPASLPEGVVRLVSADPVARLRAAEAGAGFLILTHDHALDFDLAEAALRRGDALYSGLIGSETKRVKFERLYVARGGNPGDLTRLVCPIGAGLTRDKRPPVIAAMVAAELLIAIDRTASLTVPISARETRTAPACLLHAAGCEGCPDSTVVTTMPSAA